MKITTLVIAAIFTGSVMAGAAEDSLGTCSAKATKEFYDCTKDHFFESSRDNTSSYWKECVVPYKDSLSDCLSKPVYDVKRVTEPLRR